MDYKSEITYWLKRYKGSYRGLYHNIKRESPEFFQYVMNMPMGVTFAEKLYLVLHSRKKPLCKHCGVNELEFLDIHRGYRDFCSRKCTANSKQRNAKRAETCLHRYGEQHYSKTADYKDQFKATCMARYGVENPGQIKENIKTRAQSKKRTFFDRLVNEVADRSIPEFTFVEYNEVREVKNWKCMGCDGVFKSNVFNKLPLCPKCHPTANYGGQSTVEKDIIAYIRTIYNGEIVENTRDIISPKEIDIYLPAIKLGIEVCGVYWHSDLRNPDIYYHQNKFIQCQEQNITLLTILDYEWFKKHDQCKNMLLYRLSDTNERIGARKCVIKRISAKEARPFVDSIHIQGFRPATCHYGMFYNDALVSYMSISKDRFAKTEFNEIVRFCSKHNVVGAFSKFVSRVKQDFGTEIKSYVDLRWGNGKSYDLNGFKIVDISKPGYWYYVDGVMYHRLSFTKKKLIKEGYSKDSTEFEIMNKRGALRFWDCGVKKYELQ
mgnify:CR=1 FL=1